MIMKKKPLLAGAAMIVAAASMGMILCTSCREAAEQDLKIIEIEKHLLPSIHCGDLFSEIRFVQLSEEETALMKSPRKVVLHRDTLYVSDGNGLFQFTTDGDFVRSLDRRGRGPEEYFGILDFAVDGNFVYILDRNRKLLEYSTGNEYVSSVTLDFFPASLAVLDDRTLLLTSACQDAVDKFHLFDAVSLQACGSFCPVNPAELTWRHFMNQTNFFVYDGRLLFHEPMNNTVYRIERDALVPVCELNLYGKNPPADFWSQTYANVMEINIKATQANYCFGTPVYAESDDAIVFTYRDAENYRMCVYSKKSGEAKQSEAIGFYEGLPPIRVENIAFHFFSGDDLSMTIPGYLFFDENDRPLVPELASKIKNKESPVVCLVKMK